MNKRRLIELSIGAAVAAVYFVAAKFGLSLAFGTAQVTTIWPPTGIALATMLLLGYKYWPAIALGAFLANITTHEPFLVALSIAGGNTLEALLGAYWLRRYAQFRESLDRLRDVVGLIIFSALFSTAIAAAIGVTSLGLGGLIAWDSWVAVWSIWWIGDMMGALVIAPLVLIWRQPRPLKEFQTRSAEVFLILVLVSLIGAYVFGRRLSGQEVLIPLTYLFFPFVIWMAVRFRQVGAALMSALIAVMAVWGTVSGLGPFALQVGPEENLVSLQLFLFVMTITGLTLAAIVAERRTLDASLVDKTNQLSRSNQELAEALRQRRLEGHQLKKTVGQLEQTKEAMLNLLEDLDEGKARTEAMVMAVGEGLVVFDRFSKVVLANQAFERLTGWTAIEALGRSIDEVLPAVDERGQPIPSDRRPYQKVLTTGKTVTTRLDTAPFSYVAKDGRRFPAAVTVTPMVFGGKISGGVNVFRDITHEQDVDRAKTEFVSLASHELRTPLTIVRWSIDMLRKYTGPMSKAQRKYVQAIDRTGREMIDLVDALLNVSRIEMGTLMIEPVPTKLDELLKETLSGLRPVIDHKNISVTTSIAKSLPLVTLDPQLIRVAITNLLTNAVKYTPVGGAIRVGLHASDGRVTVSIKDTGYGIPVADRPKIFSKLFRAGNIKNYEPHGTGLGLYITKAVIEQSGGKIWFTANKPQGTTFSFELPVAGVPPRPGSKTLTPS